MYTDRTQKTGKTFVAILTLALATVFTGTSLPAAAQTGRLSSHPGDLRDAFAKHPANASTPKAFAKYVAQNPALGERYARHFGVPQERVVSFFQNALVPQTLTQSRTLTTFGVTDGGQIYPVKTTLPAGTKVWATRENVPVLKWNCSNPLTTLLPGSTLNTMPLEYASVPSSILPSGSPVLDVPGTLTATSSELPSTEDPSGLAIAPPLPGVDFSFGVPTDVVGSAALPGLGEIIDAGGSSIDDLWPALFIPVIFAATQGGNDGGIGTGETPPLQLPDSGNPLPPGGGAVVVPEGNTASLLLVGLPILGATFGFAARRKKN